eukprot:6179963-Pleurochrysis_carterae.AAC.1
MADRRERGRRRESRSEMSEGRRQRGREAKGRKTTDEQPSSADLAQEPLCPASVKPARPPAAPPSRTCTSCSASPTYRNVPKTALRPRCYWRNALSLSLALLLLHPPPQTTTKYLSTAWLRPDAVRSTQKSARAYAQRGACPRACARTCERDERLGAIALVRARAQVHCACASACDRAPVCVLVLATLVACLTATNASRSLTLAPLRQHRSPRRSCTHKEAKFQSEKPSRQRPRQA